jgi:predicted RNA-binding protein YlxR (DUF448 family)
MTRATPKKRRTLRTCVGCGVRDDAMALLRLNLAGGQVVCDVASPQGRGAHVHPRTTCILAAPRRLARAFRADVHSRAADLGARVATTSERRMLELLIVARRRRALEVGTAAASAALVEGAPLAIVAADAGAVWRTPAVNAAIVAGRAIAWRAKDELGGLLGRDEVALCAVRDEQIASDLKRMRAAVDAGMMAAREGEECCKRPEAR